MTYFFIRKLSDDLRGALEADAQASGQPIQETVRQILCAHYELDCPPPERNSWKRSDAWNGSDSIHLRMPTDLWEELKIDSQESGESMQSIVHEALAAHYDKNRPRRKRSAVT